MKKYKMREMSGTQRILSCTSAALLLFGVMAFFLSSFCGGNNEEWCIIPLYWIEAGSIFGRYLMHLMLSVGIAALVYRGMGLLMSGGEKRKILRVLLCVLLVIWHVVLISAGIKNAYNGEKEVTLHDNTPMQWTVSRTEELNKLRERSKIFGRGDHYYTYPEHMSLAYVFADTEAGEMTEEIEAVVEKERSKAYHAFGSAWYSDTMLPILSFCYGRWIEIMYVIIAVSWMASAAAGFAAVKGMGRRLLYGSCGISVGVMVLLPILDYYGVAASRMMVPFTYADWLGMVMVGTLPLAIMHFLVFEHRKNLKE